MRGVMIAAIVTLNLRASAPTQAEDVAVISLCQLISDPPAYNHKLIQVTGHISRGFEDFTISDESCENGNTVWLELGGTQGSEVMYCCNVPIDPKRSEPLVVEGV